MSDLVITTEAPNSGAREIVMLSGSYETVRGGLGQLSGISFHPRNGAFVATDGQGWIKVFEHSRRDMLDAEILGCSLSCQIVGIDPSVEPCIVSLGQNEDNIYDGVYKKHFGESMRDRYQRLTIDSENTLVGGNYTSDKLLGWLVPLAEQAYYQALEIMKISEGIGRPILLDDPNWSNLIIANSNNSIVPIWVDGFKPAVYKNGRKATFKENAATLTRLMKKRFDEMLCDDNTGARSWELRCQSLYELFEKNRKNGTS